MGDGGTSGAIARDRPMTTILEQGPNTTVAFSTLVWYHDTKYLENRRNHDVHDGTTRSLCGLGRLGGSGGSGLLARD
jgi:hypothetical protein